MMRGIRNILWLLPLVLAASFPLWRGPLLRVLTPPGKLQASLAGTAPRPIAPSSFSMEGVLFTQFENGVQNWQIKADRLATGESEEVLMMDKVEGQVLSGERRKFLITGQEGKYDAKSRLLTLSRDVTIRSDAGHLVHAEQVSYNDQTRKIATSGPVTVSGKNMEISGKGLAYDLEKAIYEISGRVRMQIRQ
ncbi:MAG: LPS export ABC transporter periplasmic protein LptC [Thermodesulfobacteriota bacterium]